METNNCFLEKVPFSKSTRALFVRSWFDGVAIGEKMKSDVLRSRGLRVIENGHPRICMYSTVQALRVQLYWV